MSDANIITFYDIPTRKAQTPWSPNTWKTRYVLNYKGIPYKTVWLEYPDIEHFSKQIGAKPTRMNRDGTPYYSLPCIQDPSTGAVIADSILIAEYLDKTYPDTPPVLPAGTLGLQHAFHSAFENAMTPMFFMFVPCALSILNPCSHRHYRAARERDFGGLKLEDLSPPGPTRDQHWKEFQESLAKVGRWIDVNGPGKSYVMGNTISYADMIIVSFVSSVKWVCGEDSKEWQELITWHGGRWAAFVETFKKFETIH